MDTAAHWKAVTAGTTGIKRHSDQSLSNTPFMAAKLSAAQIQEIQKHTRSLISFSLFAQLVATSIRRALEDIDEDISPDDTAFILSTTKGNIELLGNVPDEQV